MLPTLSLSRFRTSLPRPLTLSLALLGLVVLPAASLGAGLFGQDGVVGQLVEELAGWPLEPGRFAAGETSDAPTWQAPTPGRPRVRRLGWGWMTHLPVEPRRYEVRPSGATYGMRHHPIRETWRLHRGLDLSGDAGTPLYAVGPGQVLAEGWEQGFGNWVLIGHRASDGERFLSFYGHMEGRTPRRVGERVNGNTLVGGMGKPGSSTGPHLHFEIWREHGGEPRTGDAFVAGFGSIDPELCAEFPRTGRGLRRLAPR